MNEEVPIKVVHACLPLPCNSQTPKRLHLLKALRDGIKQAKKTDPSSQFHINIFFILFFFIEMTKTREGCKAARVYCIETVHSSHWDHKK